jgi:hypothetical protein
VADDADIYLSLRSIAETRQDWVDHPFAELYKMPDLQAFFEPWRDLATDAESDTESATEVLKNEFGLTWDELFELFPGQSALVLYHLPELILKQVERPEVLFMAEYAGDPAQLEALMQVQFERNAEKHQAINPAAEHALIEESFMGETLYLDETFDGEATYIEDGYALVDGIFILATPETRLRSAVEAIKEGPDSPLVENPAYLRSREAGGRGDLRLYLNLEAILPPLNAAMLEKALASGAAMFGVSAQSLNGAFALESMQAAYVDLDLVEGGLRSYSGLIYREKAGLLSMLTYTGEPLPAAPYVPERVFSTSVTSFDLGQMFTQLEKLLTTASPMMRMQIDAQLQTIRTNTGVDLRVALLENFYRDMVTLSILPEGASAVSALMEPDQVYVLGLKDAEALSSALEALKDMVPGMREQIETQEFAGETIHTIRMPQNPAASNGGGNTVSYAITRAHFILSVGRLGLLQEVLSGMEAGGDGFWQMTETEDLFEAVAEPGAVTRSYLNLEELIVPLLQSMAQASQLGGGARALDPARIPTNLELPFHLVSELNEAEDGFFSRALILQMEALK